MLKDKLEKQLLKAGSTQCHNLYDLFLADLTENSHLKYGVRYVKYKLLIDKMIDQALEELISFEEYEAKNEQEGKSAIPEHIYTPSDTLQKAVSLGKVRLVPGESIDSEY